MHFFGHYSDIIQTLIGRTDELKLTKAFQTIETLTAYCRKITLLVLPRKLNANYHSGKYIKSAIATLIMNSLLRFDNCRIQHPIKGSKKLIRVFSKTDAKLPQHGVKPKTSQSVRYGSATMLGLLYASLIQSYQVLFSPIKSYSVLSSLIQPD
jgi:hypothetical protein